MSTSLNRNVTINMRTTEKDKSLLQKAAELAGFSNLTNFIMTAARQEANQILRSQQVTTVSQEDWERLQALLKSSPEPTEALRELMTRQYEKDDE